jgi:hypothetical protein
MPVVVEIVARLGDTVIDFTHVSPGARYRIANRTFIAKPGTYQVGLVAITMERLFRVEQPVPRRRAQVRPLIYGASSLALHIAILFIAFFSEPFERMTARYETRPRLVVRIEAEPPPVKHAARTSAPAATGPQFVGKRPAPKRHARHTRASGEYTAETVGEAFDKAIARVGTPSQAMAHAFDDAAAVYNEDDANQNDFGNHLWDIDNDPDYATIKTPKGYDLSELAGYADLYELEGEAKTKRRFEMQVALAHKSAARGDCFPAHRIAKWLEKLDKNLFTSMYLADDAIVTCLRQEVDPRVQWHGRLPK